MSTSVGMIASMSMIFRFCTGKWTRWGVLAIWIVVGMGMGSLQPKLQKATKNDPLTYLPGKSDAARVLSKQRANFESGSVTPTILLFVDRGGNELSASQKKAIDDALSFVDEKVTSQAKNFKKAELTVSPFPIKGQEIPGMVAADHKAAYGLLPLTGEDANTEIIPAVKDTRTILKDKLPESVRAYVTGPGGISADSVEVFQSIDLPLLIGTVILVLVLLIATYRSPVIWFIPLFTVMMAYMIAAGIVYLLVDAGHTTANSQTTAILIVLMFGAGTDYCLLMVSRLREELRRHATTYDAVQAATKSTFGAILSSGSTVVAAMLMLAFATLDSTATMGPVLALGVGLSMLAAFTLLPALLSLSGRWAFWPRIPRAGDTDEGMNGSGVWAKVGRFVRKSPVRSLVMGLLILGVFAIGNTVTPPNLGFGDTDSFSKPTDSSRGFDELQRHYPKGQLAASTILIEVKDESKLSEASNAVIQAVRADTKHVKMVDQTQQSVSRNNRMTSVDFYLQGDPFNDRAERSIGSIRTIASKAAIEHGATALIGGPTAQVRDTTKAVYHDNKVLIPAVLALIFVILILLVRALVAPVHLIVSVVVSFFATLGFTTFLFMKVLDHPGTDSAYPFYLFIFVVALGVDYNIFLIHRIRQEAASKGTVAGTVEAVARTGGVITSAGLILAGTFMVLGTLPVYVVKQIGIGVAIGVLFDTFIVRSFLVPAMVMMLGERNWWPRKSAGSAGAPPPPIVGGKVDDEAKEPASTIA